VAVIGDAVRRDVDRRVRLGDAVADRAAGIVVVPGYVGESPDIGRVGACTGMRGAGEVEAAQSFALHPGRRSGGGVCVAVIGDAVRRDVDRRVRLGDAVADRAAGVVVVPGYVGESPDIGRVGACVAVRGSAQVKPAQTFALDARCRVRGGVRVAVVGQVVGGDYDCGICLVDVVMHGAAGRVVIAVAVEGPSVGRIVPGCGVRGAVQVEQAG